MTLSTQDVEREQESVQSTLTATKNVFSPFTLRGGIKEGIKIRKTPDISIRCFEISGIFNLT
jgi:hypothetical protein